MSSQSIEAKYLADRMRKGVGVSSLLHSQDSSTHYADSLQRFQKDYATVERERRQEEKLRRQAQLERKRLEYLERENRRWEIVEQDYARKMERESQKVEEQRQGVRRIANTNGLAYNPINLSYDKNPEGEKLRLRDEDAKIRGYVRAHNMDFRGNSKFNPLNGGDRVGVQKIIPNELAERYEQKLNNHYQELKIKVPASSDSIRPNPRNYY